MAQKALAAVKNFMSKIPFKAPWEVRHIVLVLCCLPCATTPCLCRPLVWPHQLNSEITCPRRQNTEYTPLGTSAKLAADLGMCCGS